MTQPNRLSRRAFLHAIGGMSGAAVLLAACGAGLAPSGDSAATSAPAAGGAATGQAVTLTYLVDQSQTNQDMTKALAAAYTAKHPNVTINVEARPGGTD